MVDHPQGARDLYGRLDCNEIIGKQADVAGYRVFRVRTADGISPACARYRLCRSCAVACMGEGLVGEGGDWG